MPGVWSIRLPRLLRPTNRLLQTLPWDKEVKMREGDFVYIDYVGRVKETNEAFDSTKEEVARREGIYVPSKEYGPVPIVIGAGWVIGGLEEALKQMKVGETRRVEIPPERGFGERKAELVKLIPLSRFRDEVKPGDVITLQGLRGRVLSVSGGRVRVDFNHPLAGKTLVYEVEVRERVRGRVGKVKAIVRHFIGEKDVEIKFVQKAVEIEIKEEVDVLRSIKKLMAEDIMKWIKSVGEVRFIETFKA
jgi:FKBP-type peptidyl-prolyl cis-trans isomerase 2